MSDEHQLIDEVHRANQARIILEHPLWIAAWDDLIQLFESQWRESAFDDQEGREQVYRMYRAAIAVRETLETHIETGQLAQIALEARNDG